MENRFEELMAASREGSLSPAEQAELLALLQDSAEHRRLAARDRLIDRWLQESRKPPLDPNLVLSAIAETPSDLAAKTLAELDRRQDFSGQILNKVQRVIRWPWLGLQP